MENYGGQTRYIMGEVHMENLYQWFVRVRRDYSLMKVSFLKN